MDVLVTDPRSCCNSLCRFYTTPKTFGASCDIQVLSNRTVCHTEYSQTSRARETTTILNHSEAYDLKLISWEQMTVKRDHDRIGRAWHGTDVQLQVPKQSLTLGSLGSIGLAIEWHSPMISFVAPSPVTSLS